MNLKKRLLSIAAAGALATGAVVTIGVGTAQAAFPADPGQLTLTPATGNESTGLTATLSEACPAGSQALVGYISGPGVTEAQGIIQSSRPVATSFQMSGIFKDAFVSAGLSAPTGTFTVRIACLGADFFTETGSFVQTVNFTPRAGANNATYVTVVPAAPTSTVLTQNNASGSFGDSVTFTADATDGVAGSVQFKDGAANLGSPQAVNASGVAGFTTTTLDVGTHPITAVFTPTNTAAFNPSTSNGVSHAVSAITTGLSLTGSGTSAQYAATTFTATVNPAAAGTVTFSEGANTLGTAAVNGAGVATYTSSTLAVGTHLIDAHFAPAAGSGATASDAPTYTHSVTAFAGASLDENVLVEVPAGGLTIALDDGANGQVDLGTAQINTGGDLLTAAGPMDNVKVTDTRAGDPGWIASGIVTDFVKPAAGADPADQFSGYNLGWAPSVITTSANQVGLLAGPAVTAGTQPGVGVAPVDPAVGLGASRVLATALDDAGNGTAVLAAGLSLNIPTDVTAGVYHATLTLSVI